MSAGLYDNLIIALGCEHILKFWAIVSINVENQVIFWCVCDIKVFYVSQLIQISTDSFYEPSQLLFLFRRISHTNIFSGKPQKTIPIR